MQGHRLPHGTVKNKVVTQSPHALHISHTRRPQPIHILHSFFVSLSPNTHALLHVHFCRWCVEFDTMALCIPQVPHDATLTQWKKFMLLAEH